MMISYLLRIVADLFGRKYSTQILLTISLVLGVCSIEEQLNDIRYYHSLSSDNAFNIVEKSLRGKSSEEEIIDAVSAWKRYGWTAKVGSIKTVCVLAPDRLEKVMPKEVVHRVCVLVR